MDRGALEKLRLEALALPAADRADIARDLIQSLDSGVDTHAAEAWDAEIQRRLRQVDSGTAEPIDRDEVRRRIQARLKAV